MADLNTEIKRRRSFAIISHPDAGKTTLTEKLLLYGGAIQLAGHVRAKKNRKSTCSDWMSMEKERGISVSTTVIQFVYNNYVLNLLDTPGHEDFSEDTYRTLMAVDAVIMLIDASRGVEVQTIKLFQVCRERNIPIITFINKIDMPAKSPFELLDQIENILKIQTSPMVWPLGSGNQFRGIYNFSNKSLYRFEKSIGNSFKNTETILKIDDFSKIFEESDCLSFKEEIEIATEELPDFNLEVFHRGELTPVFFGSAISNFGIDLLLKNFIEVAPSPQAFYTSSGVLYPENNQFTAFVFKLQANMNKKHRDRVAFVRIISGEFKRGMQVNQPRLGKVVRLSSPVSFFGQERFVVDQAYPGDIIGLINPHLYQIGDILSTGIPPKFSPLPKFAPEIFAQIIPNNTEKLKAFKKGLKELSEEGVVQIFNMNEVKPLIGAIGQLQFDLFQHRLQNEYGVPCRLEKLPYMASRWMNREDLRVLNQFDKIVTDEKGNPVVLFESSYRIESLEKKYSDVVFSLHPLNSND